MPQPAPPEANGSTCRLGSGPATVQVRLSPLVVWFGENAQDALVVPPGCGVGWQAPAIKPAAMEATRETCMDGLNLGIHAIRANRAVLPDGRASAAHDVAAVAEAGD